MSKRHAGHAGSWYSDNRDELDKQLTKWPFFLSCHVFAPRVVFRVVLSQARWVILDFVLCNRELL